MTLLTLDNFALRTILTACMTTQLGEVGWRWSTLRVVVRLNTTIKSLRVKCWRSFTLTRLEIAPLVGVQSRESSRAFLLVDVIDSSRTGLTLRSAYLRQLGPHRSQRMFVLKPFGAFHHTLESRVLQAPQVGLILAGRRSMDPLSSSSMIGVPRFLTSSRVGYDTPGCGFLFSSLSFVLR